MGEGSRTFHFGREVLEPKSSTRHSFSTVLDYYDPYVRCLMLVPSVYPTKSSSFCLLFPLRESGLVIYSKGLVRTAQALKLNLLRNLDMPTSLPLLPFSHNRSTPAFPLPSTAAASSSSSVSHASSPLTPTRTRPPPLSAKARGKQRANPFLSSPSDLTTVENSQRQSLAHPASRHLTIRFTSEGVPDLSLIIEPSESLGQLKNRVCAMSPVLSDLCSAKLASPPPDQIRSLRPALSFNPLRFIHLGRVLPPETIIIPTLTRRTRLRPSETSRADDKKRGETAPAADQGKEDQAQEGLWLQCSVGLPVQEQEDGEIDKRQGEEAAVSGLFSLRTQCRVGLLTYFHSTTSRKDLSNSSTAWL